MPGEVKKILDHLIESRSEGSDLIAWDVEAKLVMAGMDPQEFSLTSEDSASKVAKAKAIATLMDVDLEAPQDASNVQDISSAIDDFEGQVSDLTAGSRDIHVIHSEAQDLDDLLASLSSQADHAGFEASAVLFFASSKRDPQWVSAGMKEMFPQAEVFGCTTAGEQTRTGFHEDSVVAMMFGASAVPDLSVAVVEELSEGADVTGAIEQFQGNFGQPIMQMSRDEYVGLILIDGLSGSEERIMADIGNRTNVPFVGASAGDDMRFETTHVFANGAHYTDAAVLVLLRPAVGFEIVKTQSVTVSDSVLTATKVTEGGREVLEFNGQPATEAYAQALGCSVEDAEQRAVLHPLGLMVGDEPFLRSPMGFSGQSMRMACQISEGMRLRVCEASNTVEGTRSVIDDVLARGPVSGLVNFHCEYRTLELTHRGQMAGYEAVFADLPTIGFGTYGEQYIGHVNQTSTMLVFR